MFKPNPTERGACLALKAGDLITPILDPLKKGAMYLTESGKVRFNVEGAQFDTPWVHPRTDPNRDCGLWHGIMFDYYGILPSPCFECWKVVVSPRTLKELFMLLDLQSEYWEGPCKCGIEVRDYTPRLYGGYFYNDSLDLGQEAYRKVRELVSEHISPDVKVILKRACTEFEMKLGPSNAWQLQPGQLEKEEAIAGLFDNRDSAHWEQVTSIRPRVMRAWIQWAYKYGDKTYLEYNDGVPLYPETVQYQDIDLSKLEKTEMEIVASK